MFAPRPRGLLVLALVLALPLALGADGAGAFRGWCRADPEFRIDRRTVRVLVDARVHNMREARALSTGEPIQIVLTLPPAIRARLLASGTGFGAGYAVSIEHSDELRATAEILPVRVAAYVPMKDSTVRIRVSLDPAGSDGLSPVAREAEESARGEDPIDPLLPTIAAGSATGTANAWISFATGP